MIIVFADTTFLIDCVLPHRDRYENTKKIIQCKSIKFFTSHINIIEAEKNILKDKGKFYKKVSKFFNNLRDSSSYVKNELFDNKNIVATKERIDEYSKSIEDNWKVNLDEMLKKFEILNVSYDNQYFNSLKNNNKLKGADFFIFLTFYNYVMANSLRGEIYFITDDEKFFKDKNTSEFAKEHGIKKILVENFYKKLRNQHTK